MTPVVFISYSHDSEGHKAWALKLATDLRASGIDAILDQWDLKLGQDLARFMESGITKSDRVLLICTDNYVSKANAGTGGVGYERLIVNAEVASSIDTMKFIPCIRGSTNPKIPTFLGARAYIDFSEDKDYQARLEELARELLGVPANAKPPLGQNPFSADLPAREEPERMANAAGILSSGKALLDADWFQQEHNRALSGLNGAKLSAHMEVRFALHHGYNHSQIELLDGVRKSAIHTFGWPIAVLLENRDEFRPKPQKDGITAEISISDGQTSDRHSYDYWSLRNTGDFFLLQSLFEDQRDPKKVFFNTRIVRVTEALLFASNLYHSLGVPPETKMSAYFAHRGFAGRILSTSNPNRIVFGAKTAANESETELIVELKDIHPRLFDLVKRVASPLFMLFDYKQFDDPIYEDIIARFQKGQVT